MLRLHNLSIRNKFFLIVFPLLVGIVYLIFLKTSESYQISNNLDELEKGVNFSARISYFVHEIQKERGNSSGFLSNEGKKFGDQLAKQRRLTDQQILLFRSMLNDPSLASFVKKNQAIFDEINELLDGIPDIRQTVDALAYTPNQAIDTYTIINTYSLNALNSLIPNTRESDITLQIQGYINFLKSKERAGIERAIGSQAFSIGNSNAEVYKRFSTLVAAQDSYMDAFLQTATTSGTEFYYKTVQGESVNEVNRMRSILYENENLDEDPIYWFATITRKIELLKKVENFLTEEVVVKAETLSNTANRQFWLFLAVTLALVAIDLSLLFSILFGLLGNIKLLSAFTDKVAQGDLSGSVDLQAKDEIGQFADTLNNSVKAIQTTQGELDKERKKALHIYETIYKTSEVVFANVDQGVFLIGQDMQISQLHSKAMERIFDSKELAGKNFMDMMSPMLVPRDREALRVFSKHLFNPRVKDNVLKRLNPVDEVQIFSGSKKDADGLKVKHIKVSFSRVSTDNKIENVMVTVRDVTQSVLLQQKIRDNEDKNRQETEQLLSIIKINPVSLREYLDKAMEGLNEIYDKYEQDKTKDFKGLVRFTFNIIHNLKGNATLIDLELMADKFHAIEETLVKLRGSDISGSDFLQVLYAINEVKKMITDMGSMLRQIANIYYNTTNDEEIFSNEKLISGFERAIKRLSDETDKKAQFIFENPDNILLPEKVKLQVNDMIMQLVRNSMVHGIESPGDRLSAGKDETGSIVMSVSKTLNDSLRIKYKDDGRGLDVDAILSKARAQGLIDQEYLNGQASKKAFELIFQDGFSTAKETTMHAGRGQGMSAVKATLAKLHGDYEIKSFDGEGLEITLALPINSPLYSEIERAQ